MAGQPGQPKAALAGPAAFWLASGHRATGKPDPCCSRRLSQKEW